MSPSTKSLATVYLAGPDVFLRDAVQIGRRKKAICNTFALEGLFPLDAELAAGGGGNLSRRIYEANVAVLARADAIVANLTPFRGVSADVGTVFELGFGCALGKPLFGYSNVTTDLRSRVEKAFGAGCKDPTTDRLLAGDHLVIEDFGLADNLMIGEALRAQARTLVTRAVPDDDIWTDLGAFEVCVSAAAAFFRQRKSAAAVA